MTYACVESTADFVANGLRVRIWRDEDPNQLRDQYNNDDIRELARLNTANAASLAALIAAQPGMNAVHVLNVATGDGLVIYPVWP